MTSITKLFKLIDSHFPGISSENKEAFSKELLVFYDQARLAAMKELSPKEKVQLYSKDAEELLTLLRDHQKILQGKEGLLVEDVIKLDQLRQWEYKLTELLLAAR